MAHPKMVAVWEQEARSRRISFVRDVLKSRALLTEALTSGATGPELEYREARYAGIRSTWWAWRQAVSHRLFPR